MPRDIALTADDAHLRPYDADRSGGLSVAEMARVPDGPAALLLENRLDAGALSAADAADWLIHLNASKAARMLADCDDRRAAGLFAGVFRADLPQALRLLRFSRESTGEPTACRGSEAALWLGALTREERTTATWLLAVLDPLQAMAVTRMSRPDAAAACVAALDETQASMTTIDREPVASPPSDRARRQAVDRNRTTVVPMRGYAVSDAAARDTLLTADVSTCTVLSLYDPVHRVGVLAHFDVNSDLHNSLDAIFADLAARGLTPRTFTARLVGGNASFATSRRLTGDLEQRLRLEGVAIAEIAPEGSGYESRSFVLDLRTGGLERYVGAYIAPDATMRDPHQPALLGRTP